MPWLRYEEQFTAQIISAFITHIISAAIGCVQRFHQLTEKQAAAARIWSEIE